MMTVLDGVVALRGGMKTGEGSGGCNNSYGI